MRVLPLILPLLAGRRCDAGRPGRQGVPGRVRRRPRQAQAQPPAPALTPRQSAIDIVNRGNELYNKGEFAKALILYRKAEGRGADLGTISFNIGNCLYRLNRLPEAAAAFRKTDRITEGKYLAAAFNLAAVLFRLEQYGECIAVYRRALRQDPDNASAWLYLADAYARTRDYVGSLQRPGEGPRPRARRPLHHLPDGRDPRGPEGLRRRHRPGPRGLRPQAHRGGLPLLHRRSPPQPGGAGAAPRPPTARAWRCARRIRRPCTSWPTSWPRTRSPSWPWSGCRRPWRPSPTTPMRPCSWATWPSRPSGGTAPTPPTCRRSRWGNKEGLEGLRNLAYEFHQQGRNDRAAEVLESARPLRPKDGALASEIAQYRDLEKEKAAPGDLEGFTKESGRAGKPCTSFLISALYFPRLATRMRVSVISYFSSEPMPHSLSPKAP